MRKFLPFLLSILLLFSLSGCSWSDEPKDPFAFLYDYYGTQQETPAPSIPSSFTLPIFHSDTLNPMICTDMTLKTVCPLLYETLFSLDTTFTPYPVLVENVQYSDCVYLLSLHPDIAFSDGSPLTSHDVQSSLLRAQMSERFGPRFSNVASIRTTDEYTVQITLMQNDPNFVSLLDIPVIKDGTEDDLCPVGTGPYVYVENDTEIYLQRNTHWWQKKKTPLQRINLLPCKSSENANYAFSVRDIQLVISDLTGTNAASISGNGNYTDAATSNLLYLGINTQKPFLAEKNIRKTLSLALNRQNLVNIFLLGHGLPAQFPISPVSPLYPSDLDITYSANAYLSALNHLELATGEKKHQMTLLVNAENKFKIDLASQIAASLSYGDIQVSVSVLPWEDYLTALSNGDFDLYLAECQLNGEWDISSLIGTEGLLNYGGYSSEILDSMLQVSMNTTAEAHQIAMHSLYSELQFESPIIPICFKNLSILTADGMVENIQPTARNPYEKMYEWIIHLAN